MQTRTSRGKSHVEGKGTTAVHGSVLQANEIVQGTGFGQRQAVGRRIGPDAVQAARHSRLQVAGTV